MKTKDEILEIVYSLIESNQGRSINIEDRHEKYNFVKDGFLDSFALLSFITDIEQNFSIQFSSEELSSEEIQSIYGLVDILIAKYKGLN